MLPSQAAAIGLVDIWGDRAPKIVGEMLYAFPEGSLALRAVEIYCGQNTTPPVEMGADYAQRMIGRREVYLWLKAVLSLTTEEVASLIPNNHGDEDAAS